MKESFRLSLILALVIGGLTALDITLARWEDESVHRTAIQYKVKADRFLSQGKPAEALEALRNAHSLVRDNTAYETEMIGALIALGKTSEAGPLIDDVLLREPNNGAANLLAGRLKLHDGDFKNAKAFYHRAIYGDWPANAQARRRDARLELAQKLLEHGSRQELLAEAISLEAESEGDESEQRRIAQLFLLAESPNRAATLYRALIAKKPDDADAYEGLGEAELQLAQYRQARASFVQASFLHRGSVAGSRFVLLNEVIELDPTSRKLSTADKFGRSARILAMAKGSLEAHLQTQPSAANTETRELLKSAATLLAERPAGPTNERAEERLDLAAKIWKTRVALFGLSTTPDEEPLRLTMERISQ